MTNSELEEFAAALTREVHSGGNGTETISRLRARYVTLTYRLKNIREVRKRVDAHVRSRAVAFAPSKSERAMRRQAAEKALAAKQQNLLHLTPSAATGLYAFARDVLLGESGRHDIPEVLGALGFVTGRRSTELLRTGQFRAHERPPDGCVHYAYFLGQLKLRDAHLRRHLEREAQANDPRVDGYTIPLLAPCAAVIAGVRRVRRYFGPLATNEEANARTHHVASLAARLVRERFAPCVARFHDLRTIYAHVTHALQPAHARVAMPLHLRSVLGHSYEPGSLRSGLHYANAWIEPEAQTALRCVCSGSAEGERSFAGGKQLMNPRSKE